TPVDDLPSITTVPATNPAPAGNSAAQPATLNPAATIVPQHDGTAPPVAAPRQVLVQPEQESFVASIFSATSVFVVMALGLFGLLVSRKLRSRQALATSQASSNDDLLEDEERASRQSDAAAPGTALVKSNGAALANG